MKQLTDRDKLLNVLKPLEAKGKVSINYDTGEVTLLGKSEQENRQIVQKFMYTSPRTCLNVMKQMEGETSDVCKK